MQHSGQTQRDYVLDALDRFEAELTRYAARMLHGNRELAADAVQHSFMKLCEQKTRQPESRLRAWLYTVCRNRIIDEFRRNSRMQAGEPSLFEMADGNMPLAVEQAGDREQLVRLHQLISGLPDQHREIVDLWSHGFKHQEIAKLTAQKAGTVRVQLHRAIQSLREKMAELEQTGPN